MTNNPTCKQDLTVHAERLREMAEDRQYSYSDAVKVGSRKAAKLFLRNAAALLAGAEALEALPLARSQAAKVWGLVCERDDLKAALEAKREAVEVAKAALVEAHEGAARQLAEPRSHDDDQWALTAIATTCEAALARLEGK
jgi:hypothetical protein